MNRKELQELFRGTAAINTPEGLKAYEIFAEALATPIKEAVKKDSIMRQLFEIEGVQPGVCLWAPIQDPNDPDSMY